MAEAAKIVLDFDVKMTKFGAAQNGYRNINKLLVA